MYFYNQKPVRLIELFAGIGSQAKAMKNLGIDFQHWFVCEFDKYAIQSYNAIHGTNFTTSDVTKITARDLNVTDTEHFTYLLTYSFPCQDLSNAGKGRGMEKGSGTRSGLLWEVERLLNECDELPQVLLMENVPQVHSVKNKEHFDKWIEFLDSKGYSNHWTDLNAKDYCIPQSRNRCYMVSILGDFSFEFPDPMPLDLRLGDMLEQEVDEKYYLSDAAIQGRQGSSFRQYNLEKSLINGKDVHPTILARYDGSPTLLDETLKRDVCNKAIEQNLVTPYDIIDPSYAKSRLQELENGEITTMNSENNQIANTLTTSASNFGVCVPTEESREPFIRVEEDSVIVREATKLGYAIATEGDSINLDLPNSNTRRGRVGKQVSQTLTTQPQMAVVEPRVIGGVGEKKSNGGRQWYQQDRIYDDNLAISVTTAFNPYYATTEPRIIREEPLERNGWHRNAKEVLSTEGLCRTLSTQSNNLATKIKEPQSLRIRKLTPKECWRLMGFNDEDVERASKICSNSQLYKQAGNSIVVNVLMAIFKELFIPKKTRSQWLDELLGGL